LCHFFLHVLFCWCRFCCCRHLKLTAAAVVAAARGTGLRIGYMNSSPGPKNKSQTVSSSAPAEWQQQISTAFSCCLFFWAEREMLLPDHKTLAHKHKADTHAHEHREQQKFFRCLCLPLLWLWLCFSFVVVVTAAEANRFLFLHFTWYLLALAAAAALDNNQKLIIEILWNLICALVALGAFGIRMHRYSVLNLLPLRTPTH